MFTRELVSPLPPLSPPSSFLLLLLLLLPPSAASLFQTSSPWTRSTTCGTPCCWETAPSLCLWGWPSCSNSEQTSSPLTSTNASSCSQTYQVLSLSLSLSNTLSLTHICSDRHSAVHPDSSQAIPDHACQHLPPPPPAEPHPGRKHPR